MDPIPFEELFRAAERGPSDVEWTWLVSRLRPWLERRLVRALYRRGATARPERLAELAQEVYCRLFDRDRQLLRGFRGDSRGQAAAYLGRIADSVAADQLRHDGARKRGREARQVDLACCEPIDRGPSPEAALLAAEARRELRRRLAAVSGRSAARRDTRILELALVHGWSSAEIASRLAPGLSRSGIDSLVHRARRRLRARGLALPHRERRC